MMRAGRQIEEAGLSDRYIAWGHSQGAQAALFAGQLSESWAPELELVGVVAGAPPYQLRENIEHLLTTDERGYAMMALVSYSSVYTDTDPEAIATPEAFALLDVVSEGCLGDIQETYEDVDTLLVPGILDTEPLASIVSQNVSAQTPIPAPVLILHGEIDETFPVETSIDLLDQICELGG
ncbi:MAG: hypothetical protein GWN58_12630, partial [Anaerolineae bacterium]|nr:hypothetical protein [Anaerolineae bacterium]